MPSRDLLKLAQEVHNERYRKEFEALQQDSPPRSLRVTSPKRVAGFGTSPKAYRRPSSPSQGGLSPRQSIKARLGGREGKLSNRHNSPKAESPREVARRQDFVKNQRSRRQQQMKDISEFRLIKEGAYDPGTRFLFVSDEYTIHGNNKEHIIESLTDELDKSEGQNIVYKDVYSKLKTDAYGDQYRVHGNFRVPEITYKNNRFHVIVKSKFKVPGPIQIKKSSGLHFIRFPFMRQLQ